MSKKRERRERARLRELRNIPLSELEGHKVHGHESGKESSKDEHAHKSHQRTGLKSFYEDNIMKLLLIPVIILIAALLQVGIQTASTGDFIHKGISLKGGITITVPSITYDALELEEHLKNNFKKADLSVRKLSKAGIQSGLIIDADLTGADEITKFTEIIKEKLKITKDDYSVEVIGSSLGESFFKQTIVALLIAFLSMSIVVFICFRIFIPSITVILCAFSDIVVTLAVVNLMGIKISTAGIAAFLMLVGYSVDTDILLTTRVLRRKEGTIMDATYSAMKTGMTMSTATLVAALVGLIFSKSDVLTQIMTILCIGMVVDMLYTWIQNVAILKWYLEKKAVKNEQN